MKFEVMEAEDQAAVIKVIGVGGCGGNAVDHMIQNGVEGVEFICANTDAQALKRNQARTLLQSFSRISNLVDLDLAENQKHQDLGALPVTEIVSIT